MSEFDKIKNDILESAKKMSRSRTSGYDTTATVTRIEGSTAWVHIPGGVVETPARLTISAKAGDTVQVRVADGSAWITGNATAPPTDDRTAVAASVTARSAQQTADSIKAKVAEIESAYITRLQVNTLLADYMKTTELVATYATIDSLTAATARISTLEADSLTAAEAAITYATIANLDAAVGRITTLETTALTAATADIRYATIDLSNVATESVKNLLVTNGIIKNATIVDGHVTGVLDAVTVNASDIVAGTLSVERLLIRGSTSGLVYALNNYGTLTSTQVNTIDGYVLTPRTITADRIVAGAITANEINTSDLYTNFLLANILEAAQAKISQLSSITANIGTVTAGILRSSDYSYTSGNTYTTNGMIIDLNNKIIRTPKTAILSDGSIYSSSVNLTGNITATSGQIGGWKIDDDDIVYQKSTPTASGGQESNYTRLSYDALSGTHSISNISGVSRFDLYTDGRLELFASDDNMPSVKVSRAVGTFLYQSTLRPDRLAFYYSGVDTTDPYRYTIQLTPDATGLSLTDGYCITASYLEATSALTINKLDPNIISNGTNLNTITNDGWYYCPYNATASTLTNCPTDQAFYMEVHTHAGTYQHIVEYMTSGAKHYYRNYYNGTWGSWVTDVSGVKGNAESSYRTGNVNLTPANIGALALTGGTLTGTIVIKIPDYTRGSYSATTQRGYLVTDSSGSANTVGSIYIGVNDTGHYSLLRVNDPTAGSSKSAQIILYYPFNDGTPYADWPGQFRITATNRGYYLTDSTGTKYGAMYDNGDNLWIGAVSSTVPHHRGANGNTYISSGYNTTNNKGNNTIYISVPSLSGSTWSQTAYGVLHTGNVASYAATGVKGNAETSYRKGNVNLTPANIGALALSGGTLTGALTLTGGGVRIDRDAAVQVDFRANNKTADVALRINSDGGNVGLYSYTKSGWIIRMASGGTVTVATTVSDIREKDVIGNLSDAETEIILRSMDIIDYTYKRDKDRLIYNGISAQQLRDTLVSHGIGYRPYLCIESADESGISYHDLMMPEKDVRYEIDYVKFTPLLWKGWQLHDGKILNHEDRISALERENNRLKKEIEILKGVA